MRELLAEGSDAAFARCSPPQCHKGERHLEVRVGNAATPAGGRQVFGAVANAGTDVAALIRRALDTLGRNGGTELTAFTNGCPGLRSILAGAGVAGPPVLDWFHLSMHLQHAKQVADALAAALPDQVQAKAEVECLRWRTWNGKAQDARITVGRIRSLLPTFALLGAGLLALVGAALRKRRRLSGV